MAYGKVNLGKFWDSLRVPEEIRLSDWADEHRLIPPTGGNPEPGRWRTSRTPYLKEILDAASDPNVREMALAFGVQLGKTEVLINVINMHIKHDPKTMLYMSSSESLAEEFGVQRIDQMLYLDKGLRAAFSLPDGKDSAKKSGRIKLSSKRFRGGTLYIGSAHSPNDVLSHPIPILLCDEIDDYPVTSSGSVVELVLGRSSNFLDKKIILCSSPRGYESDILRRVDLYGKREYMIPCMACGDACTWEWDLVKYEPGDYASARIECPKCGAVMRGSGAAPSDLLSFGWWEQKSGPKDNTTRGYRLNSLYSPWLTLAEMARSYDSVYLRNDVPGLTTFYNMRLAKLWDDEHIPAPQQEKVEDIEPVREYPNAPEEGVGIFAGIDVQHDRFEVSVLAISEGEAWVLAHKVVECDTSTQAGFDALTEYLRHKHTIPGHDKERLISQILIDSGDGKRTTEIYKYVASCRGRVPIVAIKGASGPIGQTNAHISQITRSNSFRAEFCRVDSGYYKHQVHEGMRGTHQRFYIPDDMPADYLLGLNAERFEVVEEKGRRVGKWVQTRKRNEALDCAAYAFAAKDVYFSKIYARVKK